MALATVDVAKKFLNIPLTDTSQDNWLTVLVPAACTAVLNYCKRQLETAAYTEYANGRGIQELPLRQRPARIQTLTGTLASNTTVTGLSSTSLLLAGMTVTGTGIPTTPRPTYIVSVDSSTQITLSVAATASGAKSLTFGPGVWLDPAGFYNRGANAFALSTLLSEGIDWVGQYAPDGTIKSGNLIRLGGGITGTTLDAIWPWEWRKGTLTVRLPPVWPAGIGNVKVVYCAGYGTDPAAEGGTLPEDITAATCGVVAFLRRTLPQGGRLQSEHLGEYSYNLAGPLMIGQIPELGEVRQLLSRYREVAL